MPHDKIAECNLMIDQAHPAPNLFENYFENFWVPKAEMISLVSNVANRTNNVMEGFNSYLARHYRCHMNLWLFLAKFRREEALFFVELAQLNFGADLHHQKYLLIIYIYLQLTI